ncbi:MAG: hypothetical protein HY884_05345 [Deltaproteobacteria bacterium]|nr:hypothetical protein [Deltaproteobacteria bacterium]
MNSKILDLANFLDFHGTRYITFLSFALNYAAGGFNTFGYHLTNVVIHILNSIMVYFLITLIFQTPAMKPAGYGVLTPRIEYVALAVSLVFISHPIQTQAVSYIVQRFASLATFFYLLSVLTYVKARLIYTSRNTAEGQSKSFLLPYAVSIVSAALAMKTKEISFTLPFIIALCEFVFFSAGEKLSVRFLFLSPFLLTLLIIPLVSQAFHRRAEWM